VVGIDPSSDLLAVARDGHGHPTERQHEGVGEALPFPNGAFDAALTVAVLHHVPDPWMVVAEMRRVAPIVVFSDADRYVQGRAPIPVVKWAPRALRLATAMDCWHNAPDRHLESDGDGVALFGLRPRGAITRPRRRGAGCAGPRLPGFTRHPLKARTYALLPKSRLRGCRLF